MENDKLFYFQEKINDVLDLQDDFQIEEIGIYFILKATYFKYKGILPRDKLCQRARFFGNQEPLLSVAKKIFTVENDHFVSLKWNSEIADIKEKSEKRRLAACARWKKTQANPENPVGLEEQERSKTEAKQKQEISKSEGNKDKDVNVDKDVKSKSELESQFEIIYRSYNRGKNLKVIPFDKLKTKFQNCLKEINFEELKQNAEDYLEYLSTASWRQKKAFDAWINSSEFFANDWKSESKSKDEKDKTSFNPENWSHLS